MVVLTFATVKAHVVVFINSSTSLLFILLLGSRRYGYGGFRGLGAFNSSVLVLTLLDHLSVGQIRWLVMRVWQSVDDGVEVGLLGEEIQVVQQI